MGLSEKDDSFTFIDACCDSRTGLFVSSEVPIFEIFSDYSNTGPRAPPPDHMRAIMDELVCQPGTAGTIQYLRSNCVRVRMYFMRGSQREMFYRAVLIPTLVGCASRVHLSPYLGLAVLEGNAAGSSAMYSVRSRPTYTADRVRTRTEDEYRIVANYTLSKMQWKRRIYKVCPSYPIH